MYDIPRNWNICLTIAFCVIAALLQGCVNKDETATFCSLQGVGYSGQSSINSLLLQETSGHLVAKLLHCDKKEYYMGLYPNSDSASLLHDFIVVQKTLPPRWNLEIGCSDAIDAYPTEAEGTRSMLSRLCDLVAKDATSHSTDSLKPENEL